MKRAEREKRLAEYIKKTVDAAPPLTEEQRSHIYCILHNVKRAPTERFETPAERAAREERERQEAELRERQLRADRLARALTECDICGVPKAGHMGESAASHGWEPRDPARVAAAFLGQE